MKTPAIIYIITELAPGGAQKVCLALKRACDENEIPSALIAGPGLLEGDAKKLSNAHILTSSQRRISLLSDIHTFFTLVKILRAYKKIWPHSIVHTHSSKAGILGRWAAFIIRMPHRIHTIHGFPFHPHQKRYIWSIYYLIELITSFITTHYVCVSSADIKDGMRLFPRFAHKYTLIRAAVPHTKFVKNENVKNKTNIFYFGTIACFKPQKNLFDLLRAFQLVHTHNPHTHIEIIGDGLLRKEIEAFINDNNLYHAITLHGWQENVSSIMQNWNAFVLTSLWEGLPCAIIEARLLKLPVVSYKTGGIEDVIKNNKNGLLFNQYDWHGVAHAMIKLSQDNKLHARLSSYSDDLSEFNTHAMWNAHQNLYCRLCVK